MESFPKNKESGISRIVGVSAGAEEGILAFFKERLENNEFERLEKEHSKGFDSLIEDTNVWLKDFLNKYGVESVDIPPSAVHVVDWARLTAEEESNILERHSRSRGFYMPVDQGIGLLLDYDRGSKLGFVQTMVHEMLHVNAFASLHSLPDGEVDTSIKLSRYEQGDESVALGLRRVGFRIFARNKEISFHDIDEAIIEELMIRFDAKYFARYPEMKDELEEREDALAGYGGEIAFIQPIKTFNDGGTEVTLNEYGYSKERKKLNQLIDGLFIDTGNQFSSREEIFDLFAKATLTGRLLPVARLIEKTYGKGAFRRLGEESAKRGRANDDIN